MVEVCALLCLFYKIPLNKLNANYCRGISHKPPFEGLLSECDGGAIIVRHGQVSKLLVLKWLKCQEGGG